MLRIHLLEAKNLVAKDKVMGLGKGKSDPYVKIYIGKTTFKSHVIKENLNPTWNEMYEVSLLCVYVSASQRPSGAPMGLSAVVKALIYF